MMIKISNLYSLILVCSIFFPFILSFVKGVSYYKKWKALLIAHFSIAILFCIWDILFTQIGVWGFNPKYITGIYLYNLPIEEVLFFIIIPYCCLFIYESVAFHFKFKIQSKNHLLIIGILSFILGIINYDKLYTILSLLICALLCAYLFYKNYTWTSSFLVAFIISMIPFLIVNGILTGGFTQEPIVWYNNSENLGIRISTIPIEDIFYGFDLLALNVIVYEYVKNKFALNKN